MPFYLNERDSIIAFIKDFQHQCRDLLALSDTTKFTLNDFKPKSLSDYYDTLLKSPTVSLSNTQQTSLSKRQHEILQLLARGYSGQEISNNLEISLKTVYYYASLLKERLGLYNRDALVKYYWDNFNS